LQGKTHQIKGLQGSTGFKGGKADAVTAHPVFHVGPGGKTTFGDDVVFSVQYFIQDLDTQMRHSDFVSIGEGKGNAEPAGIAIFVDGIDLSADVATGLGA
jgi:hypothetical protein